MKIKLDLEKTASFNHAFLTTVEIATAVHYPGGRVRFIPIRSATVTALASTVPRDDSD